MLTSGCVSYPISHRFWEEAKATLAAGFRTADENPVAYRGRIVIWGGRILHTVNETNGDYFTVLDAPLDRQEHPESTLLSLGRFIVTSPSFLDPENYRAGATVTIAGEWPGARMQKVGNRAYSVPS